MATVRFEEKNISPTRGVNFLWQNEDFTIEQGLDFILAHFAEPLWPRNVSTAATTNGQRPVYDRDRAILYFQGALRADCKLAIYSNYQELAKMGCLPLGINPNPATYSLTLTWPASPVTKTSLTLPSRAL
jgi:hypothetical protein